MKNKAIWWYFCCKAIWLLHFGRRGIISLRAPDATSPRQYPSKKYRLAITTLRTPDARSAQSNNVIVGSRLNAPTLRCRCVVTPRLIANKDYVTVPSFRPRRGFAVLAKCFRLDTASPPAAPSVRCRHDATPRRPLQDKLQVICVCRSSSGLNLGGVCNGYRYL